MQFTELHTPRLTLRLLVPEAYDYIHKQDDNKIMGLLGLPDDAALQKEKNKYSNGIATYNRTFANFQLIDKANGTIIGGCGYHTWFPEHYRAEIGYALHNDSYKQKGLMSEAANAIFAYGFDVMGLRRIEALIAEENTASRKLLEKFGFVREGVMRKHYNINGINEDSVMYSLLPEEFRKIN